jgi:hypothetical protein
VSAGAVNNPQHGAIMTIVDIFRRARAAFTVTDKLFRLSEPPKDLRTRNRTRLTLLECEDRVVPALVAPGQSWDDAVRDKYGEIITPATVSLYNYPGQNQGYLEVSGGGGTAIVSPGVPVAFYDERTNTTYPPPPSPPHYAFNVSGQNGGKGHVIWNGDAVTLSIDATGNVAPVTITGDLQVSSGMSIGSLNAHDVTANAALSIANVNATDDVLGLIAGTTTGVVTAAANVVKVSATEGTGPITAGGDVVWVDSTGSIQSISAGQRVIYVSTEGTVTGNIDAGTTIGAFYPAGQPFYEYFWYGDAGGGFAGGIHAKVDVAGNVTAGSKILSVTAGHSVSGNVTSTGGDILSIKGATYNQGGGVSGRITAAQSMYSLVSGGSVTGDVLALNGFIGTINANDSITGLVKAKTDIGIDPVNQMAGKYPAFIDTGWAMLGVGVVSKNGSITGGVEATTGGIWNMISAGGDITGKIKAGSSIGSVNQDQWIGIAAGDNSGVIMLSGGGIIAQGSIDATITAGQHIEGVMAQSGISGAIQAGGSIGPVYVYGSPTQKAGIAANIVAGSNVGAVTAPFGSITSNITAGAHLGNLNAGVNISGNVQAGGNFGGMESGITGGGTISGMFKAGGSIGAVTAWGTAGAGEKTVGVTPIDSPPIELVSIDELTGEEVTAKLLKAAVSTGGNILGQIEAGTTLKSLTAFGAIGSNINIDTLLGALWAAGDITGQLTAPGGAADITTWGMLTGKVIAESGVTVSAYDSIANSITSTVGSVRLSSWNAIDSKVSGVLEIAANALNAVTGTFTSLGKGVDISSANSLVDAVVTAVSDIGTLAKRGMVLGSYISTSGSGVIAGFQDVKPDTVRMYDYLVVLSKGNIESKDIIISQERDVIIAARGNLKGDVSARGALSISVAGKITGSVRSTLHDVDILCAGLTGNITAGTDVQFKCFGDYSGTIKADNDIEAFIAGNLSGSVRSEKGEIVSITALGNVSGSVSADVANISIRAYGDVTAPITSSNGGIQMEVDGSITAAITAYDQIGIDCYGAISGAILTSPGGGRVQVTAEGDITGAVTASGSAAVFSAGSILAPVTAGKGGDTVDDKGNPLTYDADVQAFDGVASNVKATGNISISSFDAISGEFTADAGKAVLTAAGTITGPITAGDSVEASGSRLIGNVVIAKSGSATLSAFEDIANITVTAGLHANLAAGTSLRATVTAGGGASLNAIDAIEAGTKVIAVGDATISGGTTVDVEVSGFNVSVSGIKTVNVTKLTAARDADVSSFKALTIPVATIGRDAVLLGESIDFKGSIGQDFTAQSKSTIKALTTAGRHVTVTALDDIVTGSIFTAGGDVLASALKGAIDAKFSADGSITLDADAGIKGSTTAGYNATLRSGATIDAPVTANQGNATVVALGGAVLQLVTAGIDASVVAATTVSAPVTATTGNAEVSALGEIKADVTAYKSASVSALQTMTGNVVAQTLNATVSGAKGVFGNVSAGNDASVSAGTSGAIIGQIVAIRDIDATAWGAILGSMNAGRDAKVWTGSSLNSVVQAQRDIDATAIGSISTPLTAGRNAKFWTRENLQAPVVAITGDVSGEVFGTDNAAVTAGGSATMWVQGSINQPITAALGGVQVTCWDAITAKISAGSGVNLWVKGDALSIVQAGLDIDATVGGGVLSNGHFIAGRDVKVMTYGNLGAGSQVVTAGRDAELFVYGGSAGAITAQGKLDLFAGGDIASTITAVTGEARIHTDGNSSAAIHSGGLANITVFGTTGAAISSDTDIALWSFGPVSSMMSSKLGTSVFTWGSWNAAATAGGGVTGFAAGSVQGSINAGGPIDISSSKSITVNIQGGDNVDLLAGGSINGTFAAGKDLTLNAKDSITVLAGTAARDAYIFGLGDFTATLKATRHLTAVFKGTSGKSTLTATSGDIAIHTTGSLSGDLNGGYGQHNLTAGGNVVVTAWGIAGGLFVNAGANVDLWARNGLGGRVKSGANTLATSFDALHLTINSTGKTDVSALGSAYVNVQSGGNVDALAVGNMTGSIVGQQNVSASSYKLLNVVAYSTESLALAGGTGIAGNYTSGRDLDLRSYGTVFATTNTARDIVRFTASGNVGGSHTAHRDILQFRSYGSINASIVAQGFASLDVSPRWHRDAERYIATAAEFTLTDLESVDPSLRIRSTYRIMESIDDSFIDDSIYVDPLNIGNINTVVARGSIGGLIIAGNSIGGVAAGGNVTAQIIRGDGQSTSVTEFDPQLAAEAGPTTPSDSWRVDVESNVASTFQEVQQGFTEVSGSFDEWFAELDKAFTLSQIETQDAKQETQDELQLALDDIAEAVADLEEAVADLDADLAIERNLAIAAESKSIAEAHTEMSQARDEAHQERVEAANEFVTLFNEAESKAALARVNARTANEAAFDNLSKAIVITRTERADTVTAHSKASAEFKAGYVNPAGQAVKFWDQHGLDKANQALDYIIYRLSWLSMIPVVGAAADLVIARIQWIRGKYWSALGHVGLAALNAGPTLLSAFRATALGQALAARMARVAAAVTRVGRGVQELRLVAMLYKGARYTGQLAHNAFSYVFCKRLGLFCFTAGTPIQTEYGAMRIEDIKTGYKVWSRDEWNLSGEVKLQVVEEVFERFAPVIEVRVGTITIGTTAEHPFYVVEKGWVKANELIPGDRLIGRDNVESVVKEIADTGRWQTVYNMRVANWHTYFVGADEWGFDVWAHNAPCMVIGFPPVRVMHGGFIHNTALVSYALGIRTVRSVVAASVRTNQALVNAAGMTISRLRPDVQYFMRGRLYVAEATSFRGSAANVYHIAREAQLRSAASAAGVRFGGYIRL